MFAVSQILLAAFLSAQIIRWVVWVGLVLLTIALLLLVRTRWGQSQPLGKCVVLSLLAHLLLAIYISTVDIVSSTVGSPDGRGLQVALIDGDTGDFRSPRSDAPDPFNAIPTTGGEQFRDAPEWSLPQTALEATSLPEVEHEAKLETASPPERRPLPMTGEEVQSPSLANQTSPFSQRGQVVDPLPIAPPVTPVATPDTLVPPPEPIVSAGPDPAKSSPSKSEAKDTSGEGSTSGSANGPLVPVLAPNRGSNPDGSGEASLGSPHGSPDVLRNRGGDHTQAAQGYGATQQSEDAVNAALRFFATQQSTNGRWDARRLGAGARAADLQDRQMAGTHADAAISGLALLAYLAAGHTHLDGPHRTTVRRGLEYLLSVQEPDGNLGASANVYEKMYAHAMATCALSEAYAMTGDGRLESAVRRALGFTIARQDRASGGWRYELGQTGDTSLLGWQVMALKSGQLAGIAIPDTTRGGIERFLRRVTEGRDGGLARYQIEARGATRPMTAEAMVCRQFLNLSETQAAREEACSNLLQELPGSGQANHYYWYYASLALHQVQGDAWRRWNDALQKQLLATQRHDGELAGSWDPDPVWGGCGGRGYSTALAALCLEVYYRFLPLHANFAGRPSQPAR